jgi:mono/diheme cytochrome c family protein
MKNFMLGFLGATTLIVVALIGCLRLGAAEVRADVRAPAWQSRLFHSAVRASVRRSAPRVQSPLSHTDDELIAGGRLYLDGCAGCHGRPGRPPRARAWFYPPPEFAHAGTQFTEPELFWIIKHGIRRTGMSAYGLPGDYSEQQLWLLADFVEHMKTLPPSVRAAILPGKP